MVRPYALLRAGFSYLTTIGEFTTTSDPHDVAIGKEGRIYILAGGNSGPVSILDIDDTDLGSFGVPGRGFRQPSYKTSLGADEDPKMDGNIVWPVQIIVDNQELIYISDEGLNRIVIYNRFGEWQGHWGELGDGRGQFRRPSGISFDADENLYVSDTMNHRVQQYTKDGKFIKQWGGMGSGEGQFNMPWGLTVDEVGDIYVADWKNDRIQKFNADGSYLRTIGIPGSSRGMLNRPSDVAVDKDGDIYVCDWGNNRVQMFTREGRYLKTFTGDATLSKSQLRRLWTTNARRMRMREMADLELEEKFQRPRSVTVDDEGHMYVSDKGGFRVQIYKKEAYPLTQDQIMPPFKSETLQNF